jgi:hypothetical protein
MLFNWLTWLIWGIGVVILIFWVFQTIREFKVLLSEHKKTAYKDK